MTNDDNQDATVPDLEPEDESVIALLAAARPSPPADFTGALARDLTDADLGWGPRPEHLWPQALVLITVGALLLLIGALVCTGGI